MKDVRSVAIGGLLLLVLLLTGVHLPAAEIVPWQEAQEHYGETVTIRGVVVATHNSGRACFLNFHEDYRNNFSAVIFAADFSKFPGKPEVLYANKTVQVTGLVKKYQGKREIIVSRPDQIEIVPIATTPKANAQDVISWQDADRHYGEAVVVEGTIVAAHNSGKACFLNFHQNWKKYFTVVIFAADFERFPATPEEFYANKKVRVTGVIKEYQGKPEIVVKDPGQITIVE